MKTFFLTTPIYYVNDVPHIGHAYTTIAADILARWKRLHGDPIFFLTGTDEHGAKIEQAAAQAGEAPEVYAERISNTFRRLWEALGISHDDYIRTTEPRHHTAVQDVFSALEAQGDIYKGVYEDWYCLQDESYFSETELVDGNCPQCGRSVQKLKEDSFFFRLSKYQEPLLRHYETHPDFLAPRWRASEIINFVSSGLRDLSVTRTRVTWGVPLPKHPGHVVYVWFDALINYISACGFRANPENRGRFAELWPADVHLVGKEIFRFHTVIWPAMLLALGLPLPKRVFAHGWWTVEGKKMSKSLGNVVDPNKMVETFGLDAFRYFLVREVPFGADGDFSERALTQRVNAELANNLGNLLQRTLTLIDKNRAGQVPEPGEPGVLLLKAREVATQFELQMKELALGAALEAAFGLMAASNKFLEETAPWKMGPDRADELAAILVESLSVIKVLAALYWPFMPGKMEDLWKRIGETEPLPVCGGHVLDHLKNSGRVAFRPGQTVIKGPPLFPRK